MFGVGIAEIVVILLVAVALFVGISLALRMSGRSR